MATIYINKLIGGSIIINTGSSSSGDIDDSDYGRIVAALESCSPSDFNMETLEYTGTNELLKSIGVGDGITSKYEIRTGETPVEMNWINLGYNGSIPEYVKYKNGNEKVYVHSITGDLGSLITDFRGKKALKRTEFVDASQNWLYEEVGDISDVSSETFEYGNNNKYAVPMSITVNGKTYEFCGYNITLNSELALNFDGFTYPCFDGNSSSRWSESPLRRWMNGVDDKGGDNYVYDSAWKKDSVLGSLKTLDARFISEDGMSKNLMSTINRTWVYDSDSIDVTTDKFWLLGNGNINHNEDWLKDYTYDTSKFNKKFEDNDDSRVRNYMNIDGTDSDTSCYWWLRSAYSHDSYYVGCVSDHGNVRDDYASNYNGVLPACTIG